MRVFTTTLLALSLTLAACNDAPTDEERIQAEIQVRNDRNVALQAADQAAERSVATVR